MKQIRENLSSEVLDFINKYIDEVYSKNKEEKVFFKEPVNDETDFLIKRNKERKIKKFNKAELERFMESIN